MITFAIFLASLILIALMFTLKGLETCYGKMMFMERAFLKCDNLIFRIILEIRHWWRHVNFKNAKLIFAWTVINTSGLAVSIKRRFDHEQSHFFAKKEHSLPSNKGSVSFFLKNVSDYKKSLREESGDK